MEENYILAYMDYVQREKYLVQYLQNSNREKIFAI